MKHVAKVERHFVSLCFLRFVFLFSLSKMTTLRSSRVVESEIINNVGPHGFNQHVGVSDACRPVVKCVSRGKKVTLAGCVTGPGLIELTFVLLLCYFALSLRIVCLSMF